MTPAARDEALTAATRAAAQRAADLDSAVADGSHRYRRRVFRTYAAAVTAVVLVGAGALGVGAAAGASSDGDSGRTAGTTTSAPTPNPTTAIPTTTDRSSEEPSTPTTTRRRPPTTPAPTTTVPPSTVPPTTAPPSTPPMLAMTEMRFGLDEGATAEAHVVDWSSGNATPVPASSLVWTSADESVASVSDLGVVTGVGGGTTTITASLRGSTATASVFVSSPIG